MEVVMLLPFLYSVWGKNDFFFLASLPHPCLDIHRPRMTDSNLYVTAIMCNIQLLSCIDVVEK